MYDLVTFGEAMVRLTSPEFMRLEQASSLSISAGGAELNVAVNGAQLGLRTAWVSRLVDNWSGKFIRNKGRELGVDMSHIVWVPFDGIGLERNGFYHLELGAVAFDPAANDSLSALGQFTAQIIFPAMEEHQVQESGLVGSPVRPAINP